MKYRNPVFRACISLVCFIFAFAAFKTALAEDWPTYRHDSQRSGVTSERLKMPLSEQWAYTSKHPPRRAWPDPANEDFWHDLKELNPLVIYDRAFQTVAVGDALYFGSSADDKIYSLDASTGEERWSFFTDAPVRLAPSIFEGKVYVGSDDGTVYCLDAANGSLLWEYRAASSNRKIPGNGRMISVWPVRTGVLVEDGIAYFGAGLFPREGVYMYALNARDGSEIWVNTPSNLSPQGYLLASPTRLYVPTGRTAPVVFGRPDGKRLRTISTPRAEGGTYALLTKGTIISGPGTKLREMNPTTGDQIATFAGRHIIVTDEVSYLLSNDGELSAIDRTMFSTVRKQRATIAAERKKLSSELSDMREKRETLDGEIGELVEKMSELGRQLKELEGSEYKWRSQCDSSYSMILAGDILFAGGDDKVDAFSTAHGRLLWTGAVTGKAYGLAVSNGRLLVSTDRGTIHCFTGDAASAARKISPARGLSPYPQDELTSIYASAAKDIIDETGIKKGYCLVLGCGEGRLAYELARLTDLRIVGIEEDEKKVMAARKALDSAGLYGVRVVVHHGSLKSLPYTDYFANLIVSDDLLISGKMPTNTAEVFRMLRPFGGVAYLGRTAEAAKLAGKLDRETLREWLRKAPGWGMTERNGLWGAIRRRALPGSGEWTHQYADAGNSACSGDKLVQEPMQVQWFGNPGPRAMIDRHNHALAPLWKDGRLFVPAAAENRVIAVDAYNGTILWDVEVPNYRRVVANKDAGNMVVTDNCLYVATEDNCWGINVATGQHMLTFKVPQLVSEQRYWGYIASAGDLLFGSGQKKTASITEHSKAVDSLVYNNRKPLATGDYLFCLNRHDGEELWHYKGGVIINQAIAVGDEHIYFVESRNPEAVADSDGRIKPEVLLANGYGYLIALDRQTGDKVWEQPVDFPFEHAIHLSYASNALLIVGARNEDGHPRYDLHAFNANDGSVKWSNHYVRTDQVANGGHGEQDQHAVIMNDAVYLIGANDYSLQTGEAGSYKLNRGGHGCGSVSGSVSYLFARGGNPRMYEITDTAESGIPLTRVSRPGCWINIIPAGGLVSIPEFSSGCTCSYPLQTSIVLMPRGNSSDTGN